MITVTKVNNTFAPKENREIERVEFKGTLKELKELKAVEGVEFEATINGFNVDDNTTLKDGDYVLLYPQVAGGIGKSILGVIATVALSVVSFGVGGLVATGVWSTTALMGAVGASAFMGYLAAAAVMFVGSTLIGRFTGQKLDFGKYERENPTYSWGEIRTMEGQNNPIAVTYGTVKSGGQSIGRRVETHDNKEYLNWLVSAGEGEIDISDIKLNDTPINYYGSVEVETRRGTNDQKIIPYFNDTYFTKIVGKKLPTDEKGIIESVQGNTIEGLIIKVNFPQGLFRFEDNGEATALTALVSVRYREKGTSGWETVSETIKGKKRDAVRKEIRIDRLTPSSYEVEVSYAPNGYSRGNRVTDTAIFESVTTIIYDDFSYPCTALIGIRALATDQLSGQPNLTFLKTRKTVLVYNPMTERYEENDADNPAWACYDVLHQARAIKNINTGKMEIEVRGVNKELIRYNDFAEWASYCNEKNFKVNIELNQLGEVLETINKSIAPIGRGAVVQFGTKFGAIFDHAQQPVQMFTMGNIIAGSFHEDFLKMEDRANAVEITFTNKEADYNRDTITIYGETYDTDDKEKMAHMTMDGITDYRQAYREGKYQLECNKRQRRTITFEAGIDAIACSLGDVILVSHDTPKWADSGRITSVDGRIITLPIKATKKEKGYILQWRTLNDNLYTRPCTIISTTDVETVVKLDSDYPQDDAPQAHDIFDLAERNVGSKPFVIKSITRAKDFTRTISAIEYDQALYDENYDIPQINYTAQGEEAKDVVDLKATLQQYTDSSNVDRAKLHLTWSEVQVGARYTVLINDGTGWVVGVSNTYKTDVTINVKPFGVYDIKVISLYGTSKSKGVEIHNVTYNSEKYGAGLIDGLRGYLKYRQNADGNTMYDIVVTWKPNELYSSYDVYYKTSNSQVVDVKISNIKTNEVGFNGEWIYGGNGTTQVVIPQAKLGDKYKILAVPKDKRGRVIAKNERNTFTILVAMRTEIPNTADNFTITFTKNKAIASWEEVTNSDIIYYEVRSDKRAGMEDGLIVRTQSLQASLPLKERKGTIYLFVRGATGKYSLPAICEYYKEKPQTPKNPPKITQGITGINISYPSIPNDCNKAVIYIDGIKKKEITTENNYYSISLDTGIYDIQFAYRDMFGVGDKSPIARFNVEPTIPKEWIDEEKLGLNRMKADIATIGEKQKTIDDVYTAKFKDFDANIDARIASGAEKYFRQNIEDKLKGVYSQITQLNDTIDSKITNKLSEVETRITQLDGEITKSVNNKLQGLESRIIQLDNTIDSKITDKVNKAETRITQTTNSILSTVKGEVSNLGKQVSNFSQTINGIEFKVERQIKEGVQDGLKGKADKDKLISQMNLAPERIKLDSRLIHISGDTLFDDNVIVGGALKSKSITADKMNVESLSAISANMGTLTAGKIKGVRYESRTGNAWIEDDEIHGMKISADSFYSAGYKIKNLDVVHIKAVPFLEIKPPQGVSLSDCIAIRILRGELLVENGKESLKDLAYKYFDKLGINYWDSNTNKFTPEALAIYNRILSNYDQTSGITSYSMNYREEKSKAVGVTAKNIPYAYYYRKITETTHHHGDEQIHYSYYKAFYIVEIDLLIIRR